MVDDAQEVDLLPGHGDWMLKRGKGIGKYTEDKLRYFTVVYVKNLQRLRLNYYTQLAGRARIPMGKRGFVAIDYVSKIQRTDKKLQIINPGFTWQLTAMQIETAVRWERILTQLILENREAIQKAPEADAPRQLPLLGRATEILWVMDLSGGLCSKGTLYSGIQQKNVPVNKAHHPCDATVLVSRSTKLSIHAKMPRHTNTIRCRRWAVQCHDVVSMRAALRFQKFQPLADCYMGDGIL